MGQQTSNFIPVHGSSNVAAVGTLTDESGNLTNDLLIKYNTGVIYRYFEARQDHFNRLAAIARSGGSVGGYIAANIRKAGIPYVKLAEIGDV